MLKLNQERIKLVDLVLTILFVLLGGSLVVYGAWLVYVPLGYILAGVLLLFIALRTSGRKGK
jgi:uncharacterized membrane protein